MEFTFKNTCSIVLPFQCPRSPIIEITAGVLLTEFWSGLLGIGAKSLKHYTFLFFPQKKHYTFQWLFFPSARTTLVAKVFSEAIFLAGLLPLFLADL
jgi:hypothetical protein